LGEGTPSDVSSVATSERRPSSAICPPPDCHASFRFIADENGIVPIAQKIMLSGAPTPVNMITVAMG
jgi:hypothetical protein